MEQEKLKVSLIIRAYNAEATIARTLESALAQECQRSAYEILVVDDGSTDNTSEVIKTFADDPRVRVIHQENRGLIGASNAGFAAASGPLVMLLDADDEAMPECVSTAEESMRDPSIEYAYGEYFEEYGAQRRLVTPADPFKTPAGAFVWRRGKLIAEGGFQGDGMFPEYEVLLRTWGRWRGVRMPRPVFIYYRSQSSMTGNGALVQLSIDSLRKKYPDRENEIKMIRSYEL